MIRLLRYLIFGDGHVHKFAILKVYEYNSKHTGTRFVYVLKCEQCGRLKRYVIDSE